MDSNRSRVWLATLAAALAAPCTLPAQGFPLTKAVPADAFLVTAERHNPAKDFLMVHWGRVWEEFQDSGVFEELLELIMLEADDEDRAEFERIVQRLGEAAAAVDWGGLVGGEVVFAERLGELMRVRGNIAGGQPDVILLMRVGDRAQASFERLRDLLEVAVDEIDKLTRSELELVRGGREGARWASFDLLQTARGAGRLEMTIGCCDDVVFYTQGASIRDEVVDLLTQTGEKSGIGDSPRFRAAFASLPAPRDGIEYVDLPNLRDGLQGYADQIFELVESEMHGDQQASIAAAARVFVGRMIASLGVADYQATVRSTEGYATRAESVAALSARAQDLPIHTAITSGRPVEDFAKYLPVETESFSVQGGSDVAAFYDFLVESVAATGPLGQQLLGIWDGVQEQHGFDLRADMLSLIDGESSSASFRLDDAPAWVWRMKLTDGEAARARLAAALAAAPDVIAELGREVPPLAAMLLLRVQPTDVEGLAGFSDVALGMAPPAVIGVKEGWLICGSSAEAVLLTEATAAGDHPNVLSNQALMARAIVPDGPVASVSYTDHGDEVEQIAAALSGMSMAGGMVAMMVPDDDAKHAIGKVFGMIARLAPVVAAIDFYEATATCATFDGGVWRSRSVTHYAPLN